MFRDKGKDYAIDTRSRCIVPKAYWDNYHDSKRIKNAKIKAIITKVRAELVELESHVLSAFYKSSTDRINKDWLINVVELYYEPKLEDNKPDQNLIGHFENYIKFKGNDLSSSTIKKYRQIKNKLIKYEEQKNKSIQIEDINYSFKQDYENYCLDKGYAINTISKDFKTIKTICKHAKKKGIEVSPELDEVKLKPEQSDSIYLTPEDIKKIESLKDIPEYLENARDWLIISCYTGQRISDFMRFEESMINETVNKKGAAVKLIHFKQQKTKKQMALPLHKTVLEILNKREGLFPRQIADQPYNRFIKEVCKRAGLNYIVKGSKKELIQVSKSDEDWRKKTGEFEKWELVSSHIGRRSFATNNYGKIPTVYLMEATGHKTEQMFLRYIGKNSQDMALELADYFSENK